METKTIEEIKPKDKVLIEENDMLRIVTVKEVLADENLMIFEESGGMDYAPENPEEIYVLDPESCLIQYNKDTPKGSGIQLITQEREEQLTKHGRTVELDVEQNKGQQLRHGAEALLKNGTGNPSLFPSHWNTQICHRMIAKPYKQRLIIAGALIAAEIDRMNYLEKQEKEAKG